MRQDVKWIDWPRGAGKVPNVEFIGMSSIKVSCTTCLRVGSAPLALATLTAISIEIFVRGLVPSLIKMPSTTGVLAANQVGVDLGAIWDERGEQLGHGQGATPCHRVVDVQRWTPQKHPKPINHAKKRGFVATASSCSVSLLHAKRPVEAEEHRLRRCEVQRTEAEDERAQVRQRTLSAQQGRDYRPIPRNVHGCLPPLIADERGEGGWNCAMVADPRLRRRRQRVRALRRGPVALGVAGSLVLLEGVGTGHRVCGLSFAG
eukprot:scaffold74618_cov67-Phaeocystis_antarctica.AAC.4